VHPTGSHKAAGAGPSSEASAPAAELQGSGSSWRGLLQAKSDHVGHQFIRYAFVGGIAFVVDFGSLYSFTEWVRLHYLVSAPLAFLLGLVTNYVLSIAWVFPTRTFRSRQVEFALFALIGVVGLTINELVIWGMTGGLGFHYLVSKIVSTAIVFHWNFFGRKLILFR